MSDNLFPACGDDSDKFQKMYQQYEDAIANAKTEPEIGSKVFGTINQKSANAKWFEKTWNKAQTINQNQKL